MRIGRVYKRWWLICSSTYLHQHHQNVTNIKVCSFYNIMLNRRFWVAFWRNSNKMFGIWIKYEHKSNIYFISSVRVYLISSRDSLIQPCDHSRDLNSVSIGGTFHRFGESTFFNVTLRLNLCVFPIAVVNSILPYAKFGPNHHRKDAPHFNVRILENVTIDHLINSWANH